MTDVTTRVEWAVQFETRHFGTETSSVLPEEQARRYCANLLNPAILNHNPTARVVTRTVTETKWSEVK